MCYMKGGRLVPAQLEHRTSFLKKALAGAGGSASGRSLLGFEDRRLLDPASKLATAPPFLAVTFTIERDASLELMQVDKLLQNCSSLGHSIRHALSVLSPSILAAALVSRKEWTCTSCM